jgi:mannose-1-phosphate guanylyltransferase
VKTFTEKPELEMARFFVDSEEFYWNSGIFLWSLNSIQGAFEEYLPDIYSAFYDRREQFNTKNEQHAINDIYPACQNISIDYGIMEKAAKASNVFVLGADFGWSDLGTWTSLFEHMPKNEKNNAISGNEVMLYNTEDTVVKVPNDKLVVIQGLKDYIVVDTEDALLICNKKEEQHIRLFVNDIKAQKGGKFV